LHGIGLGNDNLSSSYYLGEGVEFSHDFATKSDSSNEVLTESFTFFEVSTSIWSHERSDWTSGENPLQQPSLTFPEVPGKEFVGSVDITSGETIGSHHRTNCTLEDFFKFAAFSNLEESVHGSLDVLDDIDLCDCTHDTISNVFGLSHGEVKRRLDEAYDLATNFPDNSAAMSHGVSSCLPGFRQGCSL
jgi:hypothetical protein